MSKGLLFKYFVLNPNKKNQYGEASRMAIKKYADVIRSDDPELASDLEAWVSFIIADGINEKETVNG